VNPFAVQELRPRACLLQRVGAGVSCASPTSLDPRRAGYRGEQAAPDAHRVQPAQLFLRNRGGAARSQITSASGADFGATSNALWVYVGYLRRKLEENGEPRLLHTVRGVGYAFREEQ
jgi:two-component system response regulator MprA